MRSRARGQVLFAFVCLTGGACGLNLVGAPLAEEIAPSVDGSNDASGASEAAPSEAGASDVDSDDAPPTPDASSDASDATIDVDANAACPIVCDNCNAGRCNVTCPGPKCGSTIGCPLGMPCRIDCTAKGACDSVTINCATAQPCRVECAQDEGCNSTTINATTAATLCLVCKGTNDSPGCNSVTCNAPAICGRSCGAGGMACKGACSTCGTLAGCP